MKREDYLKILEAHGAPEHVKRHCMAVGDAAVGICAALSEAGAAGLDAVAVRTAGYLHDIARAGKDHDTAGAALLREMDLAMPEETRLAAADIVERHMKLNFPVGLDGIDSAAVVSLADRVVKEDRFVGYEARMEDLLKRYEGVPEVAARVHENMERALSLIAQIEAATGRALREIVTGGRVDAEPLFMKAERPGRYIGGEINSIRKEWNGTPLHFCFAFPDLYEIGMSYTGMQILYGLLNAREDTLCERAFAPAEDMARLLAEGGLPLFSLENRMPVRGFDIVGFTLQYELCYTNAVRMLGQSGIPVFAAGRGDGDPFVVAGGPCCANAEPVAPFFDLVCVGDGEEALPALADAYLAWKQGGRRDGRDGFLLAASKIPGVYAPAFYEPVYETAPESGTGAFPVFSRYEKRYPELPDRVGRAVVADLDAAFFPERPLVSHIESVHDRVAVEIMRGCYRKCRFCQASYACAGVRKRSPGRVKELVFAGLANTGSDEASLLSLSTGDYPGIEALVSDLMDELSRADAALSLPSLRLDSLKGDTLKKIAEYKRTGLTFAPEAGTQRLRDFIGKQITEDDLLRTLDICLPLGFAKYKLYFMIGLPSETYEDLDGIAELAGKAVRRAKEICAARGGAYRFHLSVSVSNFAPKPGTPFERACGDGEEELLAKIYYLKDAVRKVKGVGFKYHDTRMSRIEMLLAKGDRRCAGAVLRAAQQGAGFDSWREHFSYENWLAAFEGAGLPAADLYADGALPLPWSLIGPGKAYDDGAAGGAEV
ncbi:MAG: TIGR03960 family B12-binding radical SAM protein [Clostridiales Family XIII bacterium]|nr:TIGR03960 family B12-binding radical SAM protein [Clostridiales Family XIII bacterium]